MTPDEIMTMSEGVLHDLQRPNRQHIERAKAALADEVACTLGNAMVSAYMSVHGIEPEEFRKGYKPAQRQQAILAAIIILHEYLERTRK